MLFLANDPTNGDTNHAPISAVKSSIRSILADIQKELEERENEEKGKEQTEKLAKQSEQNKKEGKEETSIDSHKVDWEEDANFINKLVDRSELYSPIGIISSFSFFCFLLFYFLKIIQYLH